MQILTKNPGDFAGLIVNVNRNLTKIYWTAKSNTPIIRVTARQIFGDSARAGGTCAVPRDFAKEE